MKFSRAKLQHLKWVRRKELIRINCFIIIAILVMVLLFMGFPIVSDAAESFTYDDTVMSHLNFNDTDLLISRNVTIPDGYSNGLFDIDNYYVYFDNDLSNGSLIWDSRIDDYSFTVNDNSLHISDCPTYCIYFTDDSHITLEFYGIGNCCYKYFYENAQSSGLIRMFYSYPNVYSENNNSWSFPDGNYTVRCLFTKSSDGNFYLNSSNPFRFYNNTFTSNNRYVNGNYCAYGNYTNNLIVTNVPTYTCPIEPYLKRASYIPDGDTVRTTDWLNVDGVQINPNFSSGGLDSQNILNGDFIYDNSNIFVSGQSSNNFDLVFVLDFPESTDFTQFNYVLNMDSTVSVDFLHQYQSGNKNANFTAYYGTQTYGSGLGDSLFDNNQFAFSGSYQGSIESNVFKIPSSTLNTFMIDSYNANNVAGTADYVVNPSEFFNRVSQLKVANYYNIPEVLQRSIIDALGIKTSMPYYQNDDSFKINTAVFTYSLDLYKDGNKITSVPLACEYDVINGTSTVTSNPGYNKDVVNQVVTDNNNDVNNDPTNPNYKNPDNYLPTVETEPNVPSDQTNNNNNSNNISGGNNSVNVVNSPSVTISQGNKYPDKGVMQSFVRIINNDKNNTVNDIDTLIGGSAYIQLLNNALVAVPDQVWSIWITALKAILGIAVSAFFLKILINWAT